MRQTDSWEDWEEGRGRGAGALDEKEMEMHPDSTTAFLILRVYVSQQHHGKCLSPCWREISEINTSYDHCGLD